jgi:hypothetical protein
MQRYERTYVFRLYINVTEINISFVCERSESVVSVVATEGRIQLFNSRVNLEKHK